MTSIVIGTSSRGWECPRCSRCYSPDVAMCIVCVPTTQTLGVARSCNLTNCGGTACPICGPGKAASP